MTSTRDHQATENIRQAVIDLLIVPAKKRESRDFNWILGNIVHMLDNVKDLEIHPGDGNNRLKKTLNDMRNRDGLIYLNGKNCFGLTQKAISQNTIAPPFGLADEDDLRQENSELREENKRLRLVVAKMVEALADINHSAVSVLAQYEDEHNGK